MHVRVTVLLLQRWNDLLVIKFVKFDGHTLACLFRRFFRGLLGLRRLLRLGGETRHKPNIRNMDRPLALVDPAIGMRLLFAGALLDQADSLDENAVVLAE